MVVRDWYMFFQFSVFRWISGRGGDVQWLNETIRNIKPVKKKEKMFYFIFSLALFLSLSVIKDDSLLYHPRNLCIIFFYLIVVFSFQESNEIYCSIANFVLFYSSYLLHFRVSNGIFLWIIFICKLFTLPWDLWFLVMLWIFVFLSYKGTS